MGGMDYAFPGLTVFFTVHGLVWILAYGFQMINPIS